MVEYFLDLINNLKTKKDFNIIEEYKSSKIEKNAVDKLSSLINEDNSSLIEKNSYKQVFSNGLYVIWFYKDGMKKIKEIITDEYSLFIAAKVYIIKLSDVRIKDIRFDLFTGIIKKINFVNSYFIRVVDFCSGVIVLSIPSISIRHFFKKDKISELSKDEWDLLELNTIY